MSISTHNRVTIVRRDAKTLEIKEVVSTVNTITLEGEVYVARGDFHAAFTAIYLSGKKTIDDVPVMHRLDDTGEYTGRTLQVQEANRVVVGERIFFERSDRFNPPGLGQTRVINTVFLSASAAHTHTLAVVAYAPLTSEFLQ